MTASEDATAARVTGVEGRMDRHEEADVREHTNIWSRMEKVQKAVNDIMKRPPAWCTLAISLLSFLLGISVTVIGMLSRS